MLAFFLLFLSNCFESLLLLAFSLGTDTSVFLIKY